KHSRGDGTVQPSFRIAATEGLGLAIYDLHAAKRLTCHVWGDAGRLTRGPPTEPAACQVHFPSGAFGLGVGALGRDYADCSARFGEFVGVAGGVAVQPTPGGAKPDYQLASGNFVPQPYLLYGCSLTGDFSQMIRFESQAAQGRTGLSKLLEQCL